MRTILSLDDDVADRLQRLRKERDVSLDDVANEALREGLAHLERPRPGRKPFKMPVADLGRCLMPDFVSTSATIELLEGPGHK